MGNAPILVNGRSYDYTNISLVISGIEIFGVKSISYAQTESKQNHYGLSQNVISRGSNTREATCSLEISMIDFSAIQNTAPDKNLLNIPMFDIIVIYGGTNGTNPITHIIKNLEFLDVGVETTLNDTENTRTFELLPTHIEFL